MRRALTDAGRRPRFRQQCEWGHEAQVGYFAQDHRGTHSEGHDRGRVAALSSIRRHRSEEIRGLLGQMLFSGEEGLKPTEALSGGEAARLIFCQLMLQKPNVLVLDEPTNHLDLESINALNIALQKFEGTVLLVTHDEDLIDEVATRVWHFGADGASGGKSGTSIIDFAGAYAEYEVPQAVR